MRIIMGAAQGCIWPTLFRLNSFWVPAQERTVLFSFPRTGPSIGTIISMIIGGLFCSINLNNYVPFLFRYGWSYFYYALGVPGIIWSIAWYILSSDAPETNKFMSKKEKDYIQMCKNDECLQDKKTKTPWLSIFRSKAFWATMIGQFFTDCGGYALWNVVPEYMNEVLFFPIKQVRDRKWNYLYIP
ncbi:unnamed protein product [Didymodactylos carnosus]|uniref:Major facilitator superfamily (MFS) profile domain-containing protein n=1 Tax=Didymodactylos carnosus TaxID=1234261 RepID=A0A8S2VUG4_9BILA|nr:unnamed protein product [Didymodactylos carnosus]CAF4416950.1 unnamed protein product [Didymodactylos carnosus]